MGDGWLYWLLIAAFTLSNSLLLIARPQLINSQFQGLLIGSIILSLSIFPQIIDWRIDYTATMGKLIREDVLASTARRKYTDYICGRITYSVSQKDEVSRGMLQRLQQRAF